MRRILITGASGFVGSHLLRLLDAQDDVIALGRTPPAVESSPAVDWIEHDLAEPLNERRLPAQIDVIVHLAQSQVYKAFPERAREIFAVNVAGTVQLLDYARRAGAAQFVFASSGGVYQLSRRPIKESDPLQPLSFYLSTKLAAETLMRSYESFFGITTIRFFFVYGPGQQHGMLIPSLVKKVKDHEPITVEGTPGLRINPIYVADAARALHCALTRTVSGPFNVAGDEVVSIAELVNRIAKTVGSEAVIRHTETDPGADLVADTTRMKELLGVSPQTTLEEGLRLAVAAEPPDGGAD